MRDNPTVIGKFGVQFLEADRLINTHLLSLLRYGLKGNAKCHLYLLFSLEILSFL